MKQPPVKKILDSRPDLWKHGRDISYSLFAGTFTLYSFSQSEGVQVLATGLTAGEALDSIARIKENGSGGSR